MEDSEAGSDHGKKSLSSNSHISISDSDSTVSQVDSFHSPLRSEEPSCVNDSHLIIEEEDFEAARNNNCRALVPVVTNHSPISSPRKAKSPGNSAAPSTNWGNSTSDDLDFAAGSSDRRQHLPRETTIPENDEVRGRPPVVVGVSKIVRERTKPEVKTVEPAERVGLEEGNVNGGERKSKAAVASILRRSERGAAVRRAALMLRILEVISCLISFSLMAADRTQGWSGDSFDRYKEYRYCLAINIVGFVYSGFQAYNVAYNLGTGKQWISHHLLYHFDFTMDQLLAYFLMSASSSAATRVDDWISNWGGDKFTLMASASIGMSFLAFVAFSLSSLISGYNLCNRDST